MNTPAQLGRFGLKRVLAGAVLAFSACTASAHGSDASLAAGSRYVAMGSSYASGMNIGPEVAGSPRRCGRATNNYAHLVAARMRLDLVDVSCGGATTAHILGPWMELPAQIDAVTPDTRLVTVTIGGNDVDYVRNLFASTCGRTPSSMPPAGQACPTAAWRPEADYQAVEQRMRRIVREIRQRAPQAKIVFVDYLDILPDAGSCADVPLDEAQITAARTAFRRLAEVTRKAAASEGAMLLPAGQLSKGHDACSSQPWSSGHPGHPIDWHPTAAGHQAIAQALVAQLDGGRPAVRR